MLTKDLRDVVAMLKRHAVWNETQAATAARGGETIGGLREQEYAAAAVALRDAVFAIESGEYIGASGAAVSGNVVTFTIPPVPRAKLRAVREICNVLNIPLAWAKSYAEAGSVECPSDEQAAELAERLQAVGMEAVSIGAGKEDSHV